LNLNPKIEAALTGIGCDFEAIRYTGKNETYLTYYTYSMVPVSFADDDETAIRSNGSVDIYTKGNFKNLKESVRTRLKSAGFSVTYGPELYEYDTGYYHTVVEWSYEEGV
jgi:hypothetical protein